MPIETSIDPRLGIVIQRIEGDLRGDEVIAAQRALYLDPEHDPAAPVLWDARMARASAVSFAEMKDMVDGSEPMWDRMAGGRTAIVVASDLDYGMGRMYQALAEAMPREVKVFRAYSLAVVWLLEAAEESS